jgi:hypothetical protein
MIAKRRGEHWQLDAQEASGLSAAIVAVVAYIPLPERELGIGLAIGNLAAALATVVGGRIMYEQFMTATGGLNVPAPAAQRAPAASTPAPSPTPSQAAAEPSGAGSAADLLARISNL